MSGGPARGSRPPFEPGNTAALVHGLDSERVLKGEIEPRAHGLVPGIIEANPHLDPRRDALAVYRYALALVRLEHAYTWLAEQSDELFADRTKGIVHGLYSRIERWEAQASRDEERLAISPRERTRLKLEQVRGRLLLQGGDGAKRDLTRLTDDELAEFMRLAEKAAVTTEIEAAGDE